MNWNLHLLRCFDRGSVDRSKGVSREQCPYNTKPGSARTGVQLQRADYWRQGWDWQAKQPKLNDSATRTGRIPS